MPKFRKKPVTIEAIQFDGSEDSFVKICRLASGKAVVIDCGGKELRIPTLEGQMTASVGDYIVKGIQGEIYPCKPDIFELTYDAILTGE